MGLLNNLQELYRTFVGPKWTQNEPAELYNVHKEFLTFDQFKMVMTNLPDYVSESQAEEIFRIADKDGNGYISYTEFKESGSAASHYRVALVVADLGLVDCDIGHSTVCPILLGQNGNWQNSQGNWAIWWNIQIKVNPTQVCDHQSHPVSLPCHPS